MGITINGTTGNDTLFGSDIFPAIPNKDDSIFGDAGNDTIFGGTGNDSINGGLGLDTIFAGDGNDRIIFRAGEFFDSVDGGTGTDTLDATAVTSAGVFDFAAGTISGFGGGNVTGIEVFFGSNTFGDTIISNGFGSYFGQGGNDSMTAGFGFGTPETLDGGVGIDTLITTPFNGNYVVNLATGLTNFGFELFLNFENLVAGNGNNTLTGTIGDNSISGGTSSDTIDGGDGNDQLFGNAGDDVLFGGSGLDTLNGGAGNDTLTGGFSVDTIFGGDGDDRIVFTADNLYDSVDGGNGTDTLDASAATLPATYDFAAGTISGFGGGNVTGIEVFLGSNTVGDTIISNGFHRYFGQGGNDIMTAGNGTPETLDGGVGIDTLITTPFNSDYEVNLATGLTNFAGELFLNFENLIAGNGNNTLTGTDGDNSISGGTASDTIDGGDGNDQLFGNAGDDVLTGGSGNDTLDGGTGNDTLTGGLDVDTIFGGDGDDRIVFTAGNFYDSVDGGIGVDTLDATAANVTAIYDFAVGTITGFGGENVSSIEVFLGSNTVGDTILSNGFNSYFGQGGNDTMTAGIGGAETLDGGDGIDTLITTPFNRDYVVNLATGLTNFGFELFLNFENLVAGNGNNTLTGTDGDNSITGGTASDTITGGDGSDQLFGNAGDDVLTGGSGNDTSDGDDLLDGGAGNDTLTGGLNVDTIFGGDGDDRIIFTAGNFYDSVDGGLGTDTLDATAATVTAIYDFAAGTITGFGGENVTSIEVFLGSNTVGETIVSNGSGSYFGQGGNDTMTAEFGTPETLDGGVGIDTLITTPFDGDYVVNLATGLTNFAGELFLNFENLIAGNGINTLTGTIGDNSITGGLAKDTIRGDLGNDQIFGRQGNDVLFGDAGNDTLTGANGKDKLNGGSGNDTLSGGTGDDKLTGGAGRDTFRFEAGFGKDKITDFTAGPGVGDVLDFTSYDGISLASLVITSVNGGLDTRIVVSGFPADTITLEGITPFGLNANDFLF